MPGKLQVGVIGAGWWSTEHHLPGLLSHPDAELAALCDPDEARLGAAAAVYLPRHTYADYREMLAREKLDCAIIVTPHATHYEVAQAALEAGLHLLLEKPLTLFARDARELLRLAGERGRVLTLGYAHNFTQNMLRGREAVTGGELGEVNYLDGTFCSDMTAFLGGNVASNPLQAAVKVNGPGEAYNHPELMGGGHGHLQLTHVLGALFYVTGLRAKTVEARMSRQGRALDMVDAIALEFENGALGLVGGTGLAKGMHRIALSVYCERGVFTADSLSGHTGLRRADGTWEALDWQPLLETRYNTTHNFLDVVLGRAPSYAPAEVGWKAVEVLDAAYRSVEQGGRPVNIEDLYD